jgi:cephalosporin hydroxylase
MFSRRQSQYLPLLLLVSAFLNVYLLMAPSAQSSAPTAKVQLDLSACKQTISELRSEIVALNKQTGQSPKEGGDEWAPKEGDNEAQPVAAHEPAGGDYNGEIGWTYGLERVASKTDNTVYDPKDDDALTAGKSRYARSPVPKGSWRVRVAKDKWVTMDEVAFAYDVWFEENQIFQYTSWLGVYVQQDPSDAFAIQDMLWRVKPDLIVEVGTNTGGGAIFYATIMKAYNPNGKIVTLDVVPKPRNWNIKNAHRCVGCVVATEHPWWGDGMITYIQGRVTEKETRDKVDKFVADAKTVLVIEDASHRYPDTLQNVESIYQWVTVGSYLLVQDTKMDRFVGQLGKKYGKLKFGPMRSVDEFVAKHSNFVVDRRFEYLLYSQHHRGFLRRQS